MEGRRLRERKGVSYDEKALEAQQYKGDFEFMDTDTENKQGRRGRSASPMRSLICMTIIDICGPCIGPARSRDTACCPIIRTKACLASRGVESGYLVVPRPRVLDDEVDEDESGADSDFMDQGSPPQSLEEASEGDHSDDSGFAAAKKPKQPTRRLATRGGAARAGIYKEPSSGDEADAESSSGAPFLRTRCTCRSYQYTPDL